MRDPDLTVEYRIGGNLVIRGRWTRSGFGIDYRNMTNDVRNDERHGAA